MPKQCKTIKEFLDFFKASRTVKVNKGTSQRPAAQKEVIILQKQKGNQVITKFKHKTNRRLYTLVVSDKTKAKKLEGAIPVNIVKKRIGKKSLTKTQ